MHHDFDEIISREGTNCLKWDVYKQRWHRDDLLPMWVADMDFRTPPFIMEALRRRLDHEVLGYTGIGEGWYDSIRQWARARYDWEVKREELIYIPGIVRGIAFVLHAFTRPGDRIVMMPPIYHPFHLVTRHNNREVVFSQLDLRPDGTGSEQYFIDFDRLRRDLRGSRVLLLCNPHNPGGRVWTREELATIAELCAEAGCLVVSDEIHADLTLAPFTHTPFATVSETAARSITLMSPSKAFNIPGIVASYAIVPDADLRRTYRTYLEANELNEGNLFGYLATEAAYSNGTEWLDAVKKYIQGNIDYVQHFLHTQLPQIGMIRPQASYLIFLDCRRLGLSQPELLELFIDRAHLALNDGTMFGPGGEGFMRINVAAPRSIVTRALTQLKAALG